MSIFKSMHIFRTSCSFAPKMWLDSCRNINQSAIDTHIKPESNLEKTAGANRNFKQKVTRLDFNDQTLSKMMLHVKSRKMRKKSNLIYFEGKRVLKEALENGIVPLEVYFSRTDDINCFDFSENTKLYKLPYNKMKVWSNLTTAPGIVAVCKKPTVNENYKHDIPVTIICDNLREPGNLGALIRNTVAAGAKNVILSKGCVDTWDPKVIRGSSGTLFRIPIFDDIDWSDMKSYLSDDTLLLVATNKFEVKERDSINNHCVVPYYEVDYQKYTSIGIIIGGETEGVSENALQFMSYYDNKMINIPLSNEVESLNSVSALSIILFEVRHKIMLNKSCNP